MEGTRHSVTSADGVRIGLLTAGSRSELLLVHSGMGTSESWQCVWDALPGQRRVTAMDRRGRGSSGDTGNYELSSEYADVATVAAALAGEQGRPVDVVGHSIGATCVLGAAALGARSAASRSTSRPDRGQLARASRRHGGRRPSWPCDRHLPHRDHRAGTPASNGGHSHRASCGDSHRRCAAASSGRRGRRSARFPTVAKIGRSRHTTALY
jgi:hypothetical protein